MFSLDLVESKRAQRTKLKSPFFSGPPDCQPFIGAVKADSFEFCDNGSQDLNMFFPVLFWRAILFFEPGISGKIKGKWKGHGKTLEKNNTFNTSTNSTNSPALKPKILHLCPPFSSNDAAGAGATPAMGCGVPRLHPPSRHASSRRRVVALRRSSSFVAFVVRSRLHKSTRRVGESCPLRYKYVLNRYEYTCVYLFKHTFIFTYIYVYSIYIYCRFIRV